MKRRSDPKVSEAQRLLAAIEAQPRRRISIEKLREKVRKAEDAD